MNWRDLLRKFKFDGSLKFSAFFLEAEIKWDDSDKKAAWELYVELITRATTQPVSNDHGVENSALKSLYELFDFTRSILKANGPSCMGFAKISVVMLNQVIRPFTAKWHKISEEDGFKKPEKCIEFRKELRTLQEHLRNYSLLLAEMAGVEDITSMTE